MNKRRGRVNREKRQDEAAGRQGYYDTLTPSERLDVLDNRLGTGLGAAKQRARLTKEAGQ